MAYELTKIAIANRGEVAVRIIHACQELGLQTVLLHSEADIQSLAYRLSNEQVCIGASEVKDSYLNIEANINGALSVGADAIHPGFGFLSENSEFAKACEQNRITFIGPSAEAIQLFGNKVSAKNLVAKTSVPTIPGYQGADQSLSTLLSEAEKIGYPVMVKATGGGGGRGLRVIESKEQAREAIESAQREGQNAFGSGQVFLEKYLGRSKHIEVQIFADFSGEVYHLFERECSIQRRHQKIIEEAGAATLDDELKSNLYEAAIKVAKAANYLGAGTVEFLVENGEYYFLEMNTRLQVEHTITECLTGQDLVKAQILTAQEKPLGWTQKNISRKGHAIECRIYTEDPYKQGLPSIGVLGTCHWPYGPGRRFDVGFEKNDEITPFYDSMIAKVIVWDETRSRTIEKMKKTLSNTIIFGLKTNIEYLHQILSHPDFILGTMTTNFIAEHFPQGLEEVPLSEDELNFAKEILQQTGGGPSVTSSPPPYQSPWVNTWGTR